MRLTASMMLIGLPLGSGAMPARAQEISGVFNMGALANTMSMGATIKSECARARGMGQRVDPDTPWCGSAAGAQHPLARPVRGAAVNTDMRYAASAALRREVLTAFIDRVRGKDPKDAGQIEAEFRQRDYNAIYAGIVRPYGLGGDDAASAQAAYLLLGWMIVHEGREPPPGSVQGVRAQVAAALSTGRLSEPETRARLGENFKLLFVVVHAGWQAARREGTLDRYAAGVADLFRNGDGHDLRTAQLTKNGFRSN